MRCELCDHCPYGHARTVMGREGAIARGQACREAGADVIIIEAPQTVDEIKRVADALDAPLLINMVTQGGKTPYVPTDELERLGYDIIVFASDVQRAAIFGMRRLLCELRQKRTGEFFPDTIGFQKREGIINSDYCFQLQERYLHLD